jgi:dinuclear metal center YbgI/SA1388 family protein
MIVLDIYNVLNNMAPSELALSFDNVGLLVGDPHAEVKKAIVALDCTPATVQKAIDQKAELIITHHPVIFEPLKTVVKGKGNVVYSCLTNGISVISMHTNLDVCEDGVNDSLAKALGLTSVVSVTDDEGFSFRMGELENEMSADEFAAYIKARLGGTVRYTCGKKGIKKVCVCGGSGGSELDLAMKNAHAFVTADVKHNVFIEASAKEFPIFDAGHFHTENVVINPLAKILNKKIPSVEFIAFSGEEIKTL